MALEEQKNAPEQQNLYEEHLEYTEWLGEIVDNKDPLQIGRCRIKVYEKFDNIPNDALPWAMPICSGDFAGGESKGFGSFSYPKLGSLVRVRFNNGDIYHPEYFLVENMNDKLKSTIKDSYENAQVLRFDEDEDLQIYYTKEKGLLIWFNGSYINIDKNKNILIEHNGGPSKLTFKEGEININSNDKILEKSSYIYLDSNSVDIGSNADAGVVRWEELDMFMKALCTIIDAKLPLNPADPAASTLHSGIFSLCKSKIAKVAK